MLRTFLIGTTNVSHVSYKETTQASTVLMASAFHSNSVVAHQVLFLLPKRDVLQPASVPSEIMEWYFLVKTERFLSIKAGTHISEVLVSSLLQTPHALLQL